MLVPLLLHQAICSAGHCCIPISTRRCYRGIGLRLLLPFLHLVASQHPWLLLCWDLPWLQRRWLVRLLCTRHCCLLPRCCCCCCLCHIVWKCFLRLQLQRHPLLQVRLPLQEVEASLVINGKLVLKLLGSALAKEGDAVERAHRLRAVLGEEAQEHKAHPGRLGDREDLDACRPKRREKSRGVPD